MGALMIFHWLIVIGFFMLAIAVIVVIVVIVLRLAGGSRQSGEHPTAAPAAMPPVASAQARLAQLDAVRSRSLITDAEYAISRDAIVGNL